MHLAVGRWMAKEPHRLTEAEKLIVGARMARLRARTQRIATELVAAACFMTSSETSWLLEEARSFQEGVAEIDEAAASLGITLEVG